VCGAAAIAAVIGIIMLPAPAIVACAAVVGFCASSILILMLAMPALLAPPGDVHRVAGAMFTISYSLAVITPVLSGLAWDLTGAAWSAFIPIGACGFVLIVLAPTIRFGKG
jgi:CP family cyanate transporter-like MFS transporter